MLVPINKAIATNTLQPAAVRREIGIYHRRKSETKAYESAAATRRDTEYERTFEAKA